MKKIISLIIAFVLIFSCFAITAFAEDIIDDFNIFEAKQPVITFSENFNKLYVDNEPFSRVDTSMLLTDFDYSVLVDEERNTDYYTGNSAYVDFSDEQKENVKDIIIDTNPAENMYRIELYFNDGSTITIYFLKDTYLEEYNKIINGKCEEYIIDFVWPEGNTIKTNKSALFGETEMLTRSELDFCDWFDVYVQNSDGSLMAYAGMLLISDENYYYVDYNESEINDYFWNSNSIGDLANYPVHKITDEELISQIPVAEQEYYEDDYGYLYNDDLTESVSTVFLIIVFAVIPLAILVVFLIQAVRKKGVYKKLFAIISAICTAELAVFTIIAVMISMFN